MVLTLYSTKGVTIGVFKKEKTTAAFEKKITNLLYKNQLMKIRKNQKE